MDRPESPDQQDVITRTRLERICRYVPVATDTRKKALLNQADGEDALRDRRES